MITNTMPNRDLMDLIEESRRKDKDTSRAVNHNKLNHNNNQSILTKNYQKEVIRDQCLTSIYVIDNSGSMGHYADGKTFEITDDGIIRKKNGVLRWKEAESKTQQIAAYNVQREMRAAYYLLNPKNTNQRQRSWRGVQSNEWKEDIDYVVIDPRRDGPQQTAHKMNILKKTLLSQRNIRGNTPLDA